MASTRVIPSILRLQGVQLALKEYLGKSETTIDYLKEVLTFEATNFSYLKEPAKFSSKAPEIKFLGVNYSYEKNSAQVINNFNLVVEPGSTLVLMGESGSGKSTLCELALGLLNPDVGEILVDGIKIDEWKRASNSTIGYLPQDPHYFTGSIRENITLQSVSTSFDDKKVWQVLEIAGLDEFVRQLPDQLETKVQEGGIQLSGGQRQRIGIARTLFQEPQLLIIDEGTNALDLKTENAFLQMLKKLEGVSTIIRVAHNIPIGSSLQKVAYIESGSLKAIGSIEYIRKEFPDLIPASN
jgi:ABC-type bacteriocin/lantibiotic exporter with double-glycine peptidase domain